MWRLTCKGGMKPVAADKHSYYQMNVKTNIYINIGKLELKSHLLTIVS